MALRKKALAGVFGFLAALAVGQTSLRGPAPAPRAATYGKKVGGSATSAASGIPAPGLLFLFDAAQGVTTSGANVTAWADQSGNGNNVVALAVPPTYDLSAINGQPGLDGTGINNQGLQSSLVTLTADNSPRTLIAVYQSAGVAASGVIFDWRTGLNNFFAAAGSGGTGYISGNGVSNSTVSAGLLLTIPSVGEWTSDGTNSAFTLNGTPLTVGSPSVSGGDNGTGGFTIMSIGPPAGRSGNGFNGKLSWSAGWNRLLDAGELASVRGILQRRFAIAMYTPLTLSADSLTVAPSGTKTFTAAGGAGSYLCSVSTNNSGAQINASTCAYTAGTTANVVDVVRVVDQAGFSYTVNVSVTSTTTKLHLVNGTQLLTVGDSTTTLATPAWWNSAFFTSVNSALSPGSVTHIQEGHPGAVAADILTNFPAWVTAHNADTVYVTIGVNDVASGTSSTKFASEIAQILQQLLATATIQRIAVTGITCYGEVWSTGPIWGTNSPNFDAGIDVFNSILESTVNGLHNPNVIFINFRKQLLAAEVTGNPGKAASGYATSDGIHPSSTGVTLESGYAFTQVTAP